MASFKFYLLSALVCGTMILGHAAEIPTTLQPELIDLTKTTPEPPTTVTETTTSTEPTTTSTTPEPTTSTSPQTTTSTSPQTTTSTTPETTTTTSTTTTPPAPPTPAPTPVPPKPIGPPDQGLWPYVDSKNVTCVIVQFAAQLNVTYAKPNSSSSELIHVILNVPANSSVVSGNCDGTEQWLTIGWPANATRNHSLTVVFAKNDTTKSYAMKSLNASLVPSIFPNITNLDTINLSHQTAEWQTPLAASYRCTPPTELSMNGETDQSAFTAKLTLSRLQEEAFRTASGNGFSAARDCSSGDIPDAVPIAVGCALGGMVLVVLVAYLVARRRSAARGYLSM